MEEIAYIRSVKNHLLDIVLSSGWYRMGLNIFTTDRIYFNNEIYRVYWLRYLVKKYTPTKQTEKVFKTCAKNFRTELSNLEIDDEIRYLYKIYKQNINFDASPTIEEYLYSINYKDADKDVFQSLCFKIYDNETLVGFGVFDLGNKSIAGIINIYHPDYKKYSLGLYLMSLKMKYCKDKNLKYYYPGYISVNYPKFNYKLKFGNQSCQILNNGVWNDIFG